MQMYHNNSGFHGNFEMISVHFLIKHVVNPIRTSSLRGSNWVTEDNDPINHLNP